MSGGDSAARPIERLVAHALAWDWSEHFSPRGSVVWSVIVAVSPKLRT
jgi:hypothetical protein